MMARAERWIGRHWRTGLLLTTAGVVIAMAAVLLYMYHLVQQVDGLSTGVTAACKQVRHTGQTCVAKPPSSIKANPAQPTISPVPGPTGPGPTDEQVYAAVSAYFRAHPVTNGKSVSAAELAAAVSNYLRAHPPAATADQVAAAVAAYLTANPPPSGPAGAQGSPGTNGVDGAQGSPGPGPTPDQIADAVRAYIEAHPLPLCPDGTQAQARTLVTTDGPVDAVVCVATDNPAPTPTG